MTPIIARTEYTPLPRTFSNVSDDEYKEKPLPRRRRPGIASSRWRKVRRCASRVCRPLHILLLLAFLTTCQLLFNTSYHPSSAPRYEIDTHETVYLAANIIDGDLIKGAWGRSLLELVERIGNERVFVSIYGGPKEALDELDGMLQCHKAIISEEDSPVDPASIPRTTLPSGESRIKRIAFLAEMRNRALLPLRTQQKMGKSYDKILFTNDVFFDPEGATRLLWGTNLNKESGKAEFNAVCAADFISSWKYYDTFATRDTEGYSLGIPLFPWFSNEGNAISRNDVLAQKDNVRVKSCWGGMIAFSGKHFAVTGEKALSFRSWSEPFWDSSECCLIHADIMALSLSASSDESDEHKTSAEREGDYGIYLNPYVRTAYTARTFKYIWLAQRFERLLAPIQWVINPLAGMPRFNTRRTEIEGQSVEDRKWVSYNSSTTTITISSPPGRDILDVRGLKPSKSKAYWATQGHYEAFERVVERGGYCGVRQLLVLKEDSFGVENNGHGGGNWDNLLNMVPPVDV